MAAGTLTDLPLHNETTAKPEAAEQLKAAKAALGFVPNMYAYMANLPAVLSQYSSGYTAFRADSGFSPVEQEVVFLSISLVNGCDYCVAAHSMVADKMTGVPETILAQLRAGETLSDSRLDALAKFTRTMTESRGRPDEEQLAEVLAAGFSQEQVLGVVLAISVKTLSNYTNHLAATEVDAAFAEYSV